MEDQQIVKPYWARSELAISETEHKYGNYCRSISYNILQSYEDSEECVNDTYMKAWNSMPPRRPDLLSIFLGKITRNLSLDRFRYDTARRRGGGQVLLALEELSECVPACDSVEGTAEEDELVELLNRFVSALPEEQRNIFLRQYWYLNSIQEIAQRFHVTESKVKSVLFRTRKKLKIALEKEGIIL